MSNDELEELKKSTQRGSRVEEGASRNSRDFVDELVDAIDEVQNGDASKTLSLYDPKLSAVMVALQRDPELLSDWDMEEVDRSAIIRTALWRGLEQLDVDVEAKNKEAIKRYATENADNLL
ncbi:hypothetical protein [Haladaptatus caseinilyticus]|uniref:hypothetical protein n=1 Tax=Haladaptatus caseinilyticus TaxID=2993314 RepID=UPI00224B339D|nr:hypothetical protein [Haladaptatus caseinilyticus]